MNVLLVSKQYPFGRPVQIGGGGSHVFYLALGLLESGLDVSLLTYKGAFKDQSPLEKFRNFNLIPCIDGRGGTGDVVINRALDACRASNPDLIHGHHFDGASLGLKLAAAFDRPMILTMHKPPKLFVDRHSVSVPKFQRESHYALWHQFATDSRIAAHIAYSNIYHDELLQVGVPEPKIRHIVHGVPGPFLRHRAVSAPPAKRLSLPTDASIILCPLRPEKSGVRTFIEAAALLRARYRQRRFLFIVTGDPKTGPQAACQAAAKNVHEARGLGLTDDLMWFQNFYASPNVVHHRQV